MTAAFSVASAALNVCLSLLLIPRYGILGAALAITINSVVLVPYFLWYVHRYVLAVPIAMVVRRSIAGPLAAAALSWVPMLMLRELVSGPVTLVLALALGFSAYLVMTLVVRVYDATDREVARAYLARG